MSKIIKRWAVNKVLNSLIVFLFAFTTLTAPLVTPNLSFAKYVLDPIETTISLSSAATYNVTAIGEISGTARLGETLTSGILTPAAATVTYKWQRSDTNVGTYEDIPGATSNTYTLTGNDYDNYIRVVATGMGSYSGIVISAYKGPVELGLITAIGEIGGTARVGSNLMAGALTPEEATAVYQWQRSSSEDGTYENIPGATSNIYTLTGSDYDYYIKVAATGTGNYTGTAISTYKGPVSAMPITAIGEIDGTAEVGSILTSGTLTPEEATVEYQWQRSSVSGGPFTNIVGAEASTYTVTAGDVGYYIKVTATGSGAYTGTVESAYIGPVEIPIPEIKAIGPISGDPRVGVMLTAGTLTPAEATAVYQWQKSSTAGGVYVNITGATSTTYTLTESDYNCYIRVTASATGSYTGNVTSAYKGPIAAGEITAIGPISGTTAVGQILTAGTLTPFGATVIYQWQRSDGTSAFTNITGATSSTFTLTGSESNCYIRVVATGAGVYTGTVISEFVGKVGASITPLSAMGPIGGTAEVGQILTAGTLSPTGAMATYQWQRSSSASGPFTSIAGATSNCYTLAPEDKDKYVRVVAIGSSTYSGTLTSTAKGPVAAGQLTAISPISGTTSVGQTLTAGTLTPLNATVTYKWQRSTITNGTYEDIENANTSTYTLKASDENYFIRVIAVASGTFTGSAISTYTGPVSMTTTPVTAIGAISGITQVNQTLTAGPVEPSGATVTYKWLRCNTEGGVYENIPGATFNTYSVTAADMFKYFKVQATGSGNYTGTATSEYKGPVTAGEITAIGLIIGTTSVGQTLTVGTLTPYGATASYQWQRSNGTTAFADIVGGTASSYTLTGNDSNCYIRVVAKGTGAYTGTVISDYVGRVGATITPVTAIGPIGGTTTVGQTLTAGTVSPTGAIVTYQWQRAVTEGGVYGNILGATANSYTLTAEDKDKYIKVAAIGSGNYSGTVNSAYKGPVTAGQLTAIGPISGTSAVGQTLTAGTLTPYGATAAYQWQRCSTTNGTYENMLNANANTYTLKTSDAGFFIRVVAEATGSCTGTAISAYTGPVSNTTIPITSIGEISGIAQVTQTLTAGPVDPSGATVTYQWQKSGTDVGIYENIPGATFNTYTLTAADMSKYIKVQAMGSGTYTGTVTSEYKGQVTAGAITAIGPISGTTSVGQTLTVGTLKPFGATASYQWQRTNSSGAFVDIIGGTASAYTLTGEDSWCYIRVVAEGNGAYTGTVFSDYVGRVVASATPLTTIGPIGGTATVGQTLTAGTVSPTGAIVTYQWQNAVTSGGIYGNILGATANSYTLTAADKDKFIKVVATGSGNYSGTVTSAYKGPVDAGQLTAIGPISGTTVVGQTLTAGTLTPSNATVDYQWLRCSTTNGIYENMLNANASTYTLKTSDAGFFIKVFVKATGACTGTAISAYTGPVSTTASAITTIAAIGAISGTAQVTQTLTAGTVDPSGATVTYQWLSCSTADGIYANIPGATSNTYTLTAADMSKYIKVQAMGSGTYTGTAASAYKGPVTAGAITGIGSILGTTSSGQTLTVGNLTPYGATASYQWQRTNSTGAFVDIIGGTASAYTLIGDDSWCYIRVVATGTGAYAGTVISDFVGRVVASATPLTSIGAISGTARIGETLVAGSLNPAGAKATYQWQSAVTSGGIYGNIMGATANSYTLTAADKDKFFKVVATGSGNYSGAVTSAYKGPVELGRLTDIGLISGTTAVGQTLTAGILTPLNATVDYQWQSCTNSNGNYEDIENANASTYTLKTSDEGFFIRVVAKATGSCTGTAISAYTGPVSNTTIPITSIGMISGTARVAQILTAGTVYPSGATVTFQWLRCDAADGVYENIPGATSNTYTLTPDEKDHYIKVQATGSGTYSGTLASAYKGPVTSGQLTAIGSIIGTTSVDQTLTVGTLMPNGATATYQWQRSDSNGGVFTDIIGGTASTYTLMGDDSWRYIRVKATGTGSYTGTVYSDRVGRVTNTNIPLSSIGSIDGVPEVGKVLTAGPLTPAGTATYQWMRADENGVYENIAGATAISYTLTAADKGKFIKVSATGNGAYSGTVISTSKGPVTAGWLTAIGSISGTTVVGQTLAAGTLTPSNATVTYQWQRCTAGGIYENILNATSYSYTLKADDVGYYIKVTAAGIGAYTGTAESNPIGPVGTTTTQITSVGAISGIAQVAKTLTAGTVNPSGATVTYQWQRSDTDVGTYEDIPGATSSTYTLAAVDLNQYIHVEVTGSGSYSGTAVSAYKGPVTAGAITAISNIIGTTTEDQTLTAGTVSPLGANVTYQWLYAPSQNGTYLNIDGATSSTYTLSSSDNGRYIKVKAIGTGAYAESSVTSNFTGPVANKPTALTAIGAISGTTQVDGILTAGTLNPSAATATYQWQHCGTVNGDYVNIPEATSITFSISESYANQYIRVKATGSGNYIGTVTSAQVGPVTAMQAMMMTMMMAPQSETTLIRGIDSDSDTYRAGETLIAELWTSSESTVAYQWQRSDASGGAYEDIEGATEETYTLTQDDIDCLIKVTVTIKTDGDTVFDESDPIGPVEPSAPITDIGAIDEKALVGSTLESGSLNPSDATAAYQWQRCDTAEGTFEDIAGADTSLYTLTDLDEAKYIRVVAAGVGGYTGTVTSAVIGPVEPSKPITAIGTISGTAQVGGILEVGTLNPFDAEAVYQWQSCDTSEGTFENITGAEESTYTMTDLDEAKFIRVVGTGINGYTGAVTSAVIGPVEPKTLITAIDTIIGTAQVGRTLEVGTLNPLKATVAYQWQRSSTEEGGYENIAGAEASTYTLTDQDISKYIQVVVTGIGAYTGAVTSAAIGPVEPETPITAIEVIIGTNEVGSILIAGILTPSEATTVYQWQRSDAAAGDYVNIKGATEAIYTLTEDDIGCYIRVTAIGTGGYSDTVTSGYIGPVTACDAAQDVADKAAADQEAADQEAAEKAAVDKAAADQEAADKAAADKAAADQEAADQAASKAEDTESGVTTNENSPNSIEQTTADDEPESSEQGTEPDDMNQT